MILCVRRALTPPCPLVADGCHNLLESARIGVSYGLVCCALRPVEDQGQTLPAPSTPLEI